MTTSFDKTQLNANSIELGYETSGGIGTPVDLQLPTCTIEDVDRAVFNLFREQIPLFFLHKKKQEHVPVIFATGERFALLTRRKPLRDAAGAIILPLISIQRKSIDQNTTLAAGQTLPHVIKRRISQEDARYQAFINKQGILNQDSVASPLRPVPAAGQIATRRKISEGNGPRLGNKSSVPQIYEIITIPPTKFFKANYDVHIWCNYIQQLNELISTIMMAYHNKHQRTFRLETSKGYWFVGQVGSIINSGDNFEDFSDSERVVRASFEMTVEGYTIEPNNATPSGIRSFLSAPQISFDVLSTMDGLFEPIRTGAPTGNSSHLILQDIDTLDSPIPGQGIGGQTAETYIDVRGDLQRKVNMGHITEIGGITAARDGAQVAISPSGERVLVVGRNSKQGETVLRTYDNSLLGDLF